MGTASSWSGSCRGGASRRDLRARWAVWASAAVLTGACAGGEGTGGPPTLRWYVFREPSGAFARAAAECTRSAGGRYRIEIAELPADADQQRIQIVRRLAARDPDLDVLGLDVIWTAELAGAGWILPWDEVAPEEAEAIRRSTLAAPLATGTYRGRLYAAPFTTNVQLLWYRTDLVEEPPRTWDELIAQAEALARRGRPHRAQVQRWSWRRSGRPRRSWPCCCWRGWSRSPRSCSGRRGWTAPVPSSASSG